ncbi:hypothetical protein BJ875DRAFT_211608 [Amylocarpus encephaloides]|uniref:Uncharacterized protein n=1 Tax=Amylocarpus encephaloides TaxID=45428 RepID=A0A9P7Y8L5_9HELO|nr:hypothetical protein BJ875DRAFT_211608 [Amylocarpus encephaloides]
MLAINQTITPSRLLHEKSDIEGISRQDLAHQNQQVLNTNPGGESAIEEIPHSDLQPKQHVWNPPPMFINTTPWKKYAAFISLATFDMAMNAVAGCAAATIGAQINHKHLTPQVLQLGALAGVTKAGITSFRELVLMSRINFVFRMLLLLMFSSFGICLVLTAEVCNIVLEETPKELLIAAVVAAIPLIFESVRDLEPKPDQEGNTDYISRPVLSIFLLVSNPLGGYVFARMAANQGKPRISLQSPLKDKLTPINQEY